MTRAVFLDRDGVLNEAIIRNGKPYSPETVGDCVIVPGAAKSLAALRADGYRLIVVTNQPDIARGKVTRQQVESINQHLRSLLPIDAVEMCEHDDSDQCDCRKPKPGMLVRAAKRDGIVLSESFMIGDRWRDVEAGRRASCRTILVGDGYGEKFSSPPDVTVANVGEAADWIIAHANELRREK
jgi:D-glycero-D-manno-heptose 1,7-bisphosphate phosphatase